MANALADLVLSNKEVALIVTYIDVSDGSKAIIDDDKYELVSKHHWHRDDAGYARTNIWGDNRKISAPRMHRLVLGCEDTKLHIDHINGNKLDNRVSNLRICSCSQNLANRGPQRNNTSGYKGVIYDKSRNKWRAEIRVQSKRMYLGRYETVEEAAVAYNVASEKYFGEFGYQNPIR